MIVKNDSDLCYRGEICDQFAYLVLQLYYMSQVYNDLRYYGNLCNTFVNLQMQHVNVEIMVTVTL